MAYLNYEGDSGKYPLFSLFAAPANSVLTTNARSISGNEGAFFLATSTFGFCSKSIFGIRELTVEELTNITSIKTVMLAGNPCLYIKASRIIAPEKFRGAAPKQYLGQLKQLFPENKGHLFIALNEVEGFSDPYWKDYILHKNEIPLVLSSLEKANYLDMRINFQIGRCKGQKEARSQKMEIRVNDLTMDDPLQRLEKQTEELKRAVDWLKSRGEE